jgi:hypothetical protein
MFFALSTPQRITLNPIISRMTESPTFPQQ